MTSWTDITDVFKAAAVELGSEQCAAKPMVNSADFSLLAAMSAVELGDVKMDQCAIFAERLSHEKVSTLHRVTFPALDECDAAAWAALLRDVHAQLLALLAQEVAVLDGMPVMESTHQFVLVWAACWDSLQSMQCATPREHFLRQLLLVFGQAVAKTLSAANGLVADADIYEDEDFSPSPAGRLSAEALDAVSLAAQLQKLADETSPFFADAEEAQRLSALLRLQASLLSTLEQTQRHVHNSILLCNRILREKKHADPQSARSFSQIAGELKDFPRLPALLGSLKTLRDAVAAAMQCTVHSSAQPDALSLFRPHIARLQLLGPLRTAVDSDAQQALRGLQSLCKDMLAVHSLASSLPQHLEAVLDAENVFETLKTRPRISFEQILQQLADLSRNRLHLLARSLLMATQHSLALDLDRYLLDALDMRGVPSVLREAATVREWVAGNASVAAWETLKSLVVCRTRIAPRMENLLALWGNVAAEALYIDEKLRAELSLPAEQQWVSPWTVTITTRLMDLHMQLLMESDVVEAVELDSFYWYWDFIAATQGQVVDKLRTLNYQYQMAIYEAKREEYEASLKAATKKNKKGNNKLQLVEPEMPRVLPPFAEDFISRGRGLLARGMFRVHVVLKQLGLLPRHSNKYTSTGLIFQCRFRAFNEVFNPPPLSYRDFISTINRDAGSENDLEKIGSLSEEMEIRDIKEIAPVLNSAITCFQNARKYFDEAKKIPTLTPHFPLLDENASKLLTNLVKVAVASTLHATKVSKTLDSWGKLLDDTKLEAKLNKSYDDNFPVIEVVVK